LGTTVSGSRSRPVRRFVDDRTGDLCFLDLRSGKTLNLTAKGSFHLNDAMASRPVISPDGEWIAYRWYDGKQTFDLRIMRRDGTGVRRLAAQDWYPITFSPDRTKLIAVSYQSSGLPEDYHLVNVTDGSSRSLFLEKADLAGIEFSPRGDRLVYSRRNGPRDNDRDLYLAAADGTEERPLLTDPGDDRYPVWTTDGKQIVFRSNRSGSAAVWSVGVEGGDPKLLRQDVGDIVLQGFDASGTLYYSASIQEQDLYAAGFDVVSGRVISLPQLFVKSFVSRNRQLTLSPDGRWLAWYSIRDLESPVLERYSVVVRRLDGGDEYVLPIRQGAGTNQIPVRWFPDAKALLLPRLAGNEMVVERVEVEGGARTEVYRGRMTLATQWSMMVQPDGRLRWAECKDRQSCELVQRDPVSGKEARRSIDRGETAFAPLLSPDQKWQAEIVRRKGGLGDDWDLYVRPASGGDPVLLAKSGEDGWIRRSGAISWSPDSRHVIYTVALGGKEDAGQEWEFRVIEKEGGAPRRVRLDGRWPVILPDGRLVFGKVSTREELWAMRHIPGM
jgi:hypothetical protein